jgi:hypothetical protein
MLIVYQQFPGYNMTFFTFAWTVLFMLYVSLSALCFGSRPDDVYTDLPDAARLPQIISFIRSPVSYPKTILFPQYSPKSSGLEFLTVIFWLTTFALLADECKWWVAFQDTYDDAYYKKYYDDAGKYVSASKTSRAATGMAAIVWLLFMVTFGFVGK